MSGRKLHMKLHNWLFGYCDNTVILILPVDHMEPVAVLDGGDDLAEVLPGCVLAEAALVPHDVVVHVAAVRELQHEVEAGLRVDHLVEAHLEVYGCEVL